MLYDVIFDAKMSSYPSIKSEYHKSNKLVDFFIPKTYSYAFRDKDDHLIEISGVLGDFRSILVQFGGP